MKGPHPPPPKKIIIMGMAILRFGNSNLVPPAHKGREQVDPHHSLLPGQNKLFIVKINLSIRF